MTWLDGGLLAGLGTTIATIIYREGRHRREHGVLTEKIECLESRTDNLDKRQDQQDVVQATILVKLDYITEGIDDLRRDKDGRRNN